VQQWAFEWKKLRDQLGTGCTAYPHYFDSYGETRSGVVGQYLQRQAEVFRSAYIRTFSLAVSQWQMPLERALDELLEHIPAVGGFFELEPTERPEWLRDFPEQCLADDSDLDGLLKEHIKLARCAPSRWVSFVTPFDTGRAKYGDLYVGAYLVTDEFTLDPDQDLFEPSAPIFIKDTLSVAGSYHATRIEDVTMQGHTGSAIPFCTSLFPMPHGYWQSDYFAIGLPVVANYCLPPCASLRVSGGAIEVVLAGNVLSQTSVWNDAWSPRYPKGGTTRCGAAAEVSSETLIRFLARRSKSCT
jgi:hypothetical protein